MTDTMYAYIWVAGIIVFAIAFSFLNDYYAKASHLGNASKEGALESIKLLAEWTKWMSGIQTATLAAVGYFINLPNSHYKVTSFAIGTVILMGAALFCCAWVLSALPSITLRITCQTEGNTGSGEFDFYELPIYSLAFRFLRLSYIASLQHWYWAMGLVTFTVFLLQA